MAGTSRPARNVTDTVVRLLREVRERKGYSQYKLAKLANISPSGLLLIERGDRRPTLEILLQLANALEIELSALLKEAEQQKAKKEAKAGKA